MSEDKKGAEQLSVNERLAKLQQRRMSAPDPTQQQVPPQHQEPIAKTEEEKPTEQIQSPVPTVLTWERAGQPSSHDRRSKVPFNERYLKDNIMIDKRLVYFYFHYLEQCRSKVEGANTMLLEFLISKGYPLDAKLLEKPFRWEDVPRKPEDE